LDGQTKEFCFYKASPQFTEALFSLFAYMPLGRLYANITHNDVDFRKTLKTSYDPNK